MWKSSYYVKEIQVYGEKCMFICIFGHIHVAVSRERFRLVIDIV